MPFTLEERPESRGGTLNPPSETRIYKAVGEVNKETVSAYAVSGTPTSVFTAQGRLYRQDIRIDPDGWQQYTITVPYGPKQKENGSYTWNFSTAGESIHITAAKAHVAEFPAASPVDPHEASIGVNAEGEAEGVDIVGPGLKFSVTFQHPNATVTLEFVKALANATGKTNSDTFLGFSPGELLFLGASGSDGSETDAAITYDFLASENRTDIVVGEITGISKKGHEYAWVAFSKAESGGSKATKPERVFIERVYDEVNFSTTFGWS